MRHLLIIASNFPPNNVVGTHRILRFTKHLSASGWKIAVLTICPSDYLPNTRIDEALLSQIPEGVAVYRTKVLRGMTVLIRLRNDFRRVFSGRAASTKISNPAPDVQWGVSSTHHPSVSQRIKDIVTEACSLPDREMGWLWYAIRQGTKISRRHRIEVIFSSGPPFTNHVVAGLLSGVLKVKWVADFRDPWSRDPWRSRNRSWMRHVQRWLERRTIQRADAVILNTQPMCEEFAEHYGSAMARKFYTVTNGYDAEIFEP